MDRRRGRDFAATAFREGIPLGAVTLACRNWGLPRQRGLDLAEEASAEAFSRTLDREFVSEADYRAYLTQTARHCAIDLLRRARRTTSFPLDSLASAVLPDGPDAALLEASLETLSEEEQTIMRLTLEGRTLDEIADCVLPADGSSANARRVRIYRSRIVALKRLRSYLEQLEDNGAQRQRGLART